MKRGTSGRWLLSGSIAAVTLFGAAQAQAQTQEAAGKEDILVTGQVDRLTTPVAIGSRLGLSPLETPASIAVIDGDDIRDRGITSVIEAVSMAPGITNVGNPGNGNTALAARGFGGQGSVLQLIDGIRLFPVAGTITFPTDPWNVERIEVLSGPSSVLYGQGALGGAVNVITKQPNSSSTQFEGEAGYGSQNTYHLAAGAGGPIGSGFSYRADASYRHSDGFVDRGRSKSIALSGALRFAPTDGLSITLRDDYGYIKPSRYFGTPLIDDKLDTSIRHKNYNVGDANIHFEDNHMSLTVDWAASEHVTISNTAYWLYSKRFYKDLESYCAVGTEPVDPADPTAGFLCNNGYAAGTTPGDIVRVDNFGIGHDQNQYGDQGTVTLKTPLGGTASNDLVVGFDANLIKLTYSHDFDTDSQFSEVDPHDFDPGLFLDTVGIAPRYRTRTTEYALFAEDRLKLGEQFSLVGGLRYERDWTNRRNIIYNADGTTSEVTAFPDGATHRIFHNTTWRVGAVYQPQSNISLYAQYATGVDPLGSLTTYTTSASQFAFTNATGHQIEAGVKASFLDGRGSATLAAYKIVKNDLVAQRAPNAPIEQIGQRSSKGIEASVTLSLPAGFGIDANGTLLDAKYDDFVSSDTVYTGNTPPGVPETAANLWLTWSGIKKLEARAGLEYVGRRFSDDANTFRVPGYTVVDAGLSYAMTRNLAVDLHVYNLFDKDYAVTTYNDEQWILGRPRSVDVAVRARF